MAGSKALFARDRSLPKVKPGDLVVRLDAGASLLYPALTVDHARVGCIAPVLNIYSSGGLTHKIGFT